MNRATSKKLSITFTNEQMRSLNAMVIDLNTTKAGVFRAAFALLQIAIEEEKKGNQIAIIRHDTRKDTIVKTITGITDNLPTPYGGSN